MSIQENLKFWFEKFKQAEVRSFTELECNVFVNLSVAEKSGEMLIDMANLSENDPFILNVVAKRAAVLQIDISNNALTFIGVISSHLGASTIYLSALKMHQKKTNARITMEEIALSFIPTGVLTDQALESLWKLQKDNREDRPRGTTDNLLDNLNEVMSFGSCDA